MFKVLVSSLLLISATLAHANTTLAADKPEKENDFFDNTLAKRLEECKEHFDLKPFLQIAITGDTKHEITPQVIESFKAFTTSGALTLPADKTQDPVAQKCANYAEGVLVGGIGHQLVMAFALAAEEAAKSPKTDDAAKK